MLGDAGMETMEAGRKQPQKIQNVALFLLRYLLFLAVFFAGFFVVFFAVVFFAAAFFGAAAFFAAFFFVAMFSTLLSWFVPTMGGTM